MIRYSARHSFLTRLFDYCVRLSYTSHIKSIVPDTLTSSSVFDGIGPRVNFHFSDQQVCGPELVVFAQELTNLLKNKGNEIEIQDLLTRVTVYLIESGHRQFFLFNDVSVSTSQFLVQCLMMSGSMSFSHLLNAFERYYLFNLETYQLYKKYHPVQKKQSNYAQ